MNLEVSLLVIRLYSVLTTLVDKLGKRFDPEQFALLFDEERILTERRLVLSLGLQAGQSILIIERYIFHRHQLAITHYNYALFSAPHHKHRYPKAQFPPTEFSGEIAAFLDDVLWELSR